MSAADPLMAVLRQSASGRVVDALEQLVREGRDRDLCRINALAFAAARGLDEDEVIATLLHAARLGLFELSWNVMCPGCGGVLAAGMTLKTLDHAEYHCALCSAGYEPTLDEVVEVSFTVSPRARRIGAHDPDTLPMWEYMRQVFWSSGADLPEDLEDRLGDVVLDGIELPAGEKAVLSVMLPPEFIIVFEPVTHTTQFIDVKGEPTRERQQLSLVFNEVDAAKGAVVMRPGPLRLSLENQLRKRTLPSLFLAGDRLHDLLGQRRPFLTAKRLLSNQTFRELYRSATMDVNQRLKITSMTFLFTDLKGSTALYDEVGDIAAFDLVRAHFARLLEIVARQGGAVVKTIGDAVMATFPEAESAVAAALQMRRAMEQLNEERGRDDLLLNIGLHEGPCLAVMLDERQDYFGQTVNVAARVQDLAQSTAIFTTGQVLRSPGVSEVLGAQGLSPVPHEATLRGIRSPVELWQIP
jgi:class 3 adenylate cyclase